MRNISVLLADDETKVRQFLESVIKKENLPVGEIFETNNGVDAAAIALEHNPDLIFLDIRMPGQDGLKAAKEIMQGGYPGKIVIVSAYNDFEYAREAFRLGVSDYLLKPVKPADFATFILQMAQSDAGKIPPGQAPSQAPRSKPKQPPALVRSVLGYISQNLNAQIRIEDIAKAVHLSPWHLSRTFKRLDGRSIMDSVREMRIERAKELLADSELSITEIAIGVGFGNPGYFATCFKQDTKMSPSEYRKTHSW